MKIFQTNQLGAGYCRAASLPNVMTIIGAIGLSWWLGLDVVIKSVIKRVLARLDGDFSRLKFVNGSKNSLIRGLD